MAETTRLELLAPGEKYTLPLPPYSTPWLLGETLGGHTRMGFRHGTLYLSMKTGKTFPEDLTQYDHDRAAALGVLFEGEPVADFGLE
ncbi:hypothetical protein DAETH_08000 [Deinococcus aetherius]|uniref:Uncharacterized protein n=1 Tax=Deinococcus aetherius TaxID=200252 RepID=A0ABN6RC02_9DEIO|nr:hypothetical protein [Deinococcus aetherius]BDP40831.1 hypothetical protein DAETH_08000 [Deinococcus aetherius]